ncbi:glycosyltransferase family 4 protein [Paenibacillus thermotolerans]|uniref:glycosyltransferase family 4 protein n=1 Tax=Paenibacillus thermotolerans TaxID=3027807 RepID=UPI0023676E14|nr:MULTISPECIES: glycosyltransferase family 4 protein [unclassified Paenibacillus]
MGDKPRVAIVTPGSYPIPSERSSSVENVVRHVGALISRSVSLWVLGKKMRGFPSSQTIGEVRYLRPPQTKSSRTYVRAASREISRLRPDIIQIENRPLFIPGFKRRHPGCKVWLSLHSTTFLSDKKFSKEALRAAMSGADCIIVNSKFLKAYVAEKFPSAAMKIRVNYLGVDSKRFVSRWTSEGDKLRTKLLGSLGLEGRKILLFVGRLIEKKGVHHILKAMPAIIERHPEVILLVVGSADYGDNSSTPYVRSLYAAAKKIKDHVRFVRYVPYDQIHQWYCMADLAVLPSFKNEAFGLVNVEAMASGVPVIATNAGGMKELIVDGETGFLIPPRSMHEHIAEKAILLLERPELIRQMGESSVQRVKERFLWEHTAKRMETWYYKAYRSPRKRR